MLLIQGLGGLDGSADVTALQQALVKLGKSVPVTGTVNDPTIAALWVVLKGNLTKARDIAKLISADASTAVGWLVSAMNAVDSTVDKVPLLTTDRLLANWVNINAVAGAMCFDNSTCLAAVKVLVDGRGAVVAGITSAAGVFAKVVTAFGTPASTTPPTTGTVQLPPNKIAMLSTFSLRSKADSIKTLVETPPATSSPPTQATSKLPGLLTQWWFWGIVGLTGGALVARRATAPRAA